MKLSTTSKMVIAACPWLLALTFHLALTHQAPAQCPTCPKVYSPALPVYSPMPAVAAAPQTFEAGGIHWLPNYADTEYATLVGPDKTPVAGAPSFVVDKPGRAYKSASAVVLQVNGKDADQDGVKKFVESLPFARAKGPFVLGHTPLIVALKPPTFYVTFEYSDVGGFPHVWRVNFTDCQECEALRLKKVTK